jgi:predicted Zn-dependent peptidase
MRFTRFTHRLTRFTAVAGFTGLAAVALVAGVAAQQGPDRAKPPALGPAPSLTLPPIVKRTLTNGLPVWIVEMHKVPLVDVTLLVKSGASADPAGKIGVANVTADMLDEGAGMRSALDIADAIAFLGGSLGTGNDWDSSIVRLHLPVANLDEGLSVMSDVALRPTFAPAEFDRVKKTRLTGILQGRDNASTLAALAFAKVLYGDAHRYGAPIGGTEASVTAMTAADVKAFHAKVYQPANAQLIVVGDVTAASILPKLEQQFGTWKNTGPVPKVTLPPPPPAAPRMIYLVDKPGAAQSQIRIGQVGVARSTPDYFTLDVVNTILGGSFTSRLNQNLREVHGYAYGASSSFSMRRSAGPFTAAAGVQTDKTTESLREFFTELSNIQELPAADLERGKNYEALGFPQGFETLSGMASQLTTLGVYDLPATYFNDYVPMIQAVTLTTAEAAARKYIVPDKFAIVVVGDLSKIEKRIRDANFAPVKILSVDDLIK